MIDRAEAIPFDVSDFRTIKFDHRDLDSVADALEQLKAQIGEIEKGTPIRTPVTFTLMLQEASKHQNKALPEEAFRELFRQLKPE